MGILETTKKRHRDEALVRQVRAPESTTIPCPVQDGLNLSVFGVISQPKAGKDKSVSVFYTLNL